MKMLMEHTPNKRQQKLMKKKLINGYGHDSSFLSVR